MATHLQREVERLKNKIIALAATVEKTVQEAVAAVNTRDRDLARKIIEGDAAIDQTEVDIEEECLKLLALYQPVATDLRFIVAAMKINNDIERVGDLAVNIAERALCLCDQPPVRELFDFAQMNKKVLAMFRGSLDALMHQDAQRARQVRALDDEVDALNREMYDKIRAALHKSPDQMDSLLNYSSVSRLLERIADGATNIAEDVIYLVEGEIVRHKPVAPA
ncbi:MAG TPA: phosphate signaling complex protein PhoU [Phycisphaerae bacterium]|nr:phosphate signaling complex protein PhoU [Phycisphaerae bacterium]HOW69729.1 phosphate signaling complex protein PhoU [Phycisphaerae bacterium]HRY70928.1 phosphate signaling complex protein PhoU [Phycisphaerae bacterium]HSA27775.1 phosphate signaling complex protein PhoU [Phycisphaerae bacterium]